MLSVAMPACGAIPRPSGAIRGMARSDALWAEREQIANETRRERVVCSVDQSHDPVESDKVLAGHGARLKSSVFGVVVVPFRSELVRASFQL